MARGLALIFGIRLMRNFDNPFLAINTRAFWQRWHISLTKWVFDYLYFPLVGRRSTQLRRSVCLVITMLIIGLWHGASWNFVLFGLYHAVVMLIQDLFHKYGLFKLPKYLAALVNMIIIGPSAILFMTPDLPQALKVVEHMVFSELPLTIQLFSGWGVRTAIVFFVLILIIETRYRGAEIAAEKISRLPTPVRWTIYPASIVILLTFGMLRENDFVYFQF
jgi:alginate O-acetyltransferase complex protein AlgI